MKSVNATADKIVVVPKGNDARGESDDEPAKPPLDFIARQFKKIDIYAVEERPHTYWGFIITMIVLLGILVYTAYIVYQFTQEEATRETEVHWTLG
eukprot:gene13565-19436_t